MKTKLKNFFLNLQFIFKPWYWIMSAPYSKDMDIHNSLYILFLHTKLYFFSFNVKYFIRINNVNLIFIISIIRP